MEAVWILLAFVLLVVAATVLVFRIEDLSRLDQGDYPVRPAVPGDGQQRVLGRLRELGESARGLKGKARLLFLTNTQAELLARLHYTHSTCVMRSCKVVANNCSRTEA